MPAHPGIQFGVLGIAVARDEPFENIIQAIDQFMIPGLEGQAFQFLQALKNLHTCFVMCQWFWKRLFP